MTLERNLERKHPKKWLAPQNVASRKPDASQNSERFRTSLILIFEFEAVLVADPYWPDLTSQIVSVFRRLDSEKKLNYGDAFLGSPPDSITSLIKFKNDLI